MDDTMMPGTGDGDAMMPGTGDGDTMMPGTGDGDMMMPGTGDGDMMMPAELNGGLVQSPQPPVYADSDEDALASSLPGGETVFSPLSAAIRLDYGGDGAAQPQQGAVYLKSISGDGEGGFHAISVIDGEETTFHIEADDYVAPVLGFYALSEDGQASYYFRSWTDAFSEAPGGPAVTDRTDGSSEFDYFDFGYWLHYIISDADGAGQDGLHGESLDSFVVYGARTRHGNLPTGDATYEGRMIASWWDAEGDPDVSLTDRYIRGTLRLEAGFGDGTISGRVDDIDIPYWNSDSGDYEPVGAISIAATTIDEAQFVANWVGENADTNAAPDRTLSGFTGTILGEFYGPAAEEVGGVLSGSRAATGTTPERFITGGFGASQPDPEQ